MECVCDKGKVYCWDTDSDLVMEFSAEIASRAVRLADLPEKLALALIKARRKNSQQEEPGMDYDSALQAIANAIGPDGVAPIISGAKCYFMDKALRVRRVSILDKPDDEVPEDVKEYFRQFGYTG